MKAVYAQYSVCTGTCAQCCWHVFAIPLEYHAPNTLRQRREPLPWWRFPPLSHLKLRVLIAAQTSLHAGDFPSIAECGIDQSNHFTRATECECFCKHGANQLVSQSATWMAVVNLVKMQIKPGCVLVLDRKLIWLSVHQHTTEYLGLKAPWKEHHSSPEVNT